MIISVAPNRDVIWVKIGGAWKGGICIGNYIK